MPRHAPTASKPSPPLSDRYANVAIRVIQILLGHQRLDNTARYTHVATKILREVKGPLEYLDMKPPV